MHYTRIEIKKNTFINNICVTRNWISKFKPEVKYCLPVKANAYGHGLIEIARLAQNYVDYFGVACLDEGAKLRTSGIDKPILVFGAFSELQVGGLIQYNLEITISSLYKAKLVSEFCEVRGLIAKVHIKIDTGMNRVGVRVESAKELIDFVCENKCFELVGIYSHLACGDLIDDEYTLMQIDLFSLCCNYARKQAPNIICHLSNSAGVINYPGSLFDMVRPGIMSYGYSPSDGAFPAELSGIKPCLSLISEITYFKVVKENQGISYNHKYITKGTTRVVTIPIGYGDGYKRALSNIGEVIIRGKKYTISGNICMDMLMVDIGIDSVAYVGDEVILIGTQGDEEILLQDVANKCNTISYEILCGFNDRILRVFV
ncbi:MAG: alanine racemase [Neisseriaceae bacterium]